MVVTDDMLSYRRFFGYHVRSHDWREMVAFAQQGAILLEKHT